jgi:hypothetical protein
LRWDLRDLQQWVDEQRVGSSDERKRAVFGMSVSQRTEKESSDPRVKQISLELEQMALQSTRMKSNAQRQKGNGGGHNPASSRRQVNG